MISVVILNWKRTEQLRIICSELNSFQLVGEIIVWNNNQEIHLELDEEKAKVVNCSEDFGLFTRFAAASLSKYPCILYHDDDLKAPESTLTTLYDKWKQKPDLCHSLFGRITRNGKYFHRNTYGPVRIVLTRYVMVHRKAAVHALTKTPEFSDMPGVPVGNGEDIILSHAAMDLSGKLNQAYNLESENLIEENEVSIHKRYPDHIKHRSKIIRRCKKVFSIRPTLFIRNWIYKNSRRVKGALESKLSNAS